MHCVLNYITFYIHTNTIAHQRAISSRISLLQQPPLFLPLSLVSSRRPKPTQHWHFPVIPCWLLGIQKEPPELWIKCQLWRCGGTVSIPDDVWLAVGPFGHSGTHRHDTESGPHLVCSRGKAAGKMTPSKETFGVTTAKVKLPCTTSSKLFFFLTQRTMISQQWCEVAPRPPRKGIGSDCNHVEL